VISDYACLSGGVCTAIVVQYLCTYTRSCGNSYVPALPFSRLIMCFHCECTRLVNVFTPTSSLLIGVCNCSPSRTGLQSLAKPTRQLGTETTLSLIGYLQICRFQRSDRGPDFHYLRGSYVVPVLQFPPDVPHGCGKRCYC